MISASPFAGKRSLTLQEERHESDHKHQEDADDAALDPLEDRDEVVATGLPTDVLAAGRVLADRDRRLQGTEEDHWKIVRRRSKANDMR